MPGQSYTGLGESEIAARVGLYHTDAAVLSVQAGLRSPGASFDSLGPLDVRRAGSLDVRGLAGHNCVVAGIEGFAEVQAGYRFYAGNQPGEWRFDLTAGLRPLPRLLVMLQSFTSISFGTSQFGHVSWTKLQPSLVYDIAQQWSVQIGGFITAVSYTHLWALNWDCPPGRRGKTTTVRATARAISWPRSSSTRAKARSIPAVIPPEE